MALLISIYNPAYESGSIIPFELYTHRKKKNATAVRRRRVVKLRHHVLNEG